MSSREQHTWRLREYQPADFDALCALDQLCFPSALAYSPDEMAFGLTQRGAVAWVAEEGTQVIAFILAASQRRSLGHIITIDVMPEFRREGLGKTLMNLAEQSLKEDGVRRVVLEVNVDNLSAVRFYRELGYGMRQTIANYYPDGSDAYLMEKSLE